MPFELLKKDDQVIGSFNGGAIKENRPVVINDGKSFKPYSNIFYWAHAWSDQGSLLSEHPHDGFEIMSFILDGEIEHYDTKNKEWKPLNKGDVQIIRAGSGISHAENFKPGSEIFQIWFDPDLSKSLLCPATYDDYKAQCFPVSTRDKMIIKDYKGVNSPLDMEASILSISEIILKQGEIEMQLNERNVYSIYLLDGKIELNKIEMEKDDYIKINTETIMMINVIQENSRIFFIESPARPYYKTYYEMFG